MVEKPCGRELKGCMPLSLSQCVTQTCWRPIIVKIRKRRFIFSSSLQVLLFPEREEGLFGLPKKLQHGLLHSACLLKPQNFMTRGRKLANPVSRRSFNGLTGHEWYLSLLTFLTSSGFWDLCWLQFGTPRGFLVSSGEAPGPHSCLLSSAFYTWPLWVRH